ncbi:MAG: sugar phosphate nucleotidyltransferase, partial [SAR324 cluster bacterium]|nr:sugar phosphate nucleotidyltransferase [SAR324 cluster bacterium]
MTPQALVFAAGLGTRLAPLTKQLPKALAPSHGIPALEWILRRLEQQQVQQVVINTHAHADKIHRFVEARIPSSLNLQISQEPILLDTGGGLRRSRSFWSINKPILKHNADFFTHPDFTSAWQVHSETKPLATQLVQQPPT